MYADVQAGRGHHWGDSRYRGTEFEGTWHVDGGAGEGSSCWGEGDDTGSRRKREAARSGEGAWTDSVLPSGSKAASDFWLEAQSPILMLRLRVFASDEVSPVKTGRDPNLRRAPTQGHLGLVRGVGTPISPGVLSGSPALGGGRDRNTPARLWGEWKLWERLGQL